MAEILPTEADLLRIEIEKTDDGDWQSVIYCDDFECWRGKPWAERWQALSHATANRASILRKVCDGLVKDLGDLDQAPEEGRSP